MVVKPPSSRVEIGRVTLRGQHGGNRAALVRSIEGAIAQSLNGINGLSGREVIARRVSAAVRNATARVRR